MKSPLKPRRPGHRSISRGASALGRQSASVGQAQAPRDMPLPSSPGPCVCICVCLCLRPTHACLSVQAPRLSQSGFESCPLRPCVVDPSSSEWTGVPEISVSCSSKFMEPREGVVGPSHCRWLVTAWAVTGACGGGWAHGSKLAPCGIRFCLGQCPSRVEPSETLLATAEICLVWEACAHTHTHTHTLKLGPETPCNTCYTVRTKSLKAKI